MKSKILKYLAMTAFTAAIITPAFAQEDPALFMGRASARVAKAMAFPNRWEGPTKGSAIPQKKGLVVVIGSDFRLGGIAGLNSALREATAVAGWNLLTLDCYGIQSRRAESFSRAMALKPTAIILAGIHSTEQPKEMKAAAAAKIPVIGWHAAPKSGPGDGLFTNVGTDPKEAGQLAALLAVVDSKGKAGVVIFNDASSPPSVAKATAIAEIIKQCQTCTLLSTEDVSPAASRAKIQEQLTSAVKRHGSRWTYVLATDDIYFDMLAMPEASTIVSAYKLQGISAGDGTPTAYQRIAKNALQIGTVPEPLRMQAWQIVDEVSRAISGAKPSEFTTPVYVVTQQNKAFHGGPKNMFDPDIGYQAQYRQIWKR
jgi:ribose transport system substrate-binding protein